MRPNILIFIALFYTKGSLIAKNTTNFHTQVFQFNICSSIQNISIGSLLPSQRKNEIENLKKVFSQNQLILDQLNILLQQDSEASGYQTDMESASMILNQFTEFKHAKFSKELDDFWKTYHQPKLRAPSAIGKDTECLSDNSDTQFKLFAQKLKNIIHSVFKSSPFNKPLLSETLPSTLFLPAGSKTFFGATANLDGEQKKRICINPEEACPFLLPKLLHELTHAQNNELMQLRLSFSKLTNEWQKQLTITTENEEKLLEFDDNLESAAPISFDILTETQPESDPIEIKKWAENSKNKISEHGSYKDISKQEGLKKHLTLWQSYTDNLIELKKLALQIKSIRMTLDQQRFLDEHRAYINELKSAQWLVNQVPQYFCKLWVPSFAAKRPVPFYAAYLLLAEKFDKNQFSQWLAETYVNAKLYLPTSIYVSEKKPLQLITDLKQKANLLIKESFQSL